MYWGDIQVSSVTEDALWEVLWLKSELIKVLRGRMGERDDGLLRALLVGSQ